MSNLCECGRPAILPISRRNTNGHKVNQYLKRKGCYLCVCCQARMIQQQMAARLAQVRAELSKGERV